MLHNVIKQYKNGFIELYDEKCFSLGYTTAFFSKKLNLA